ncbi:MAG: DUF2914 domain-containing protein [Pseudomonadota bacterium]
MKTPLISCLLLFTLTALQVTARAEDAPAAAAPETPASATAVTRAQITSAIADREPTDKLDKVVTSVDRVYFFTEISNFSGHTIRHQWLHKNQLMAEISFEVTSPRWRGWSSKKLIPSLQGPWHVLVLDEQGNVLTSVPFTYGD